MCRDEARLFRDENGVFVDRAGPVPTTTLHDSALNAPMIEIRPMFVLRFGPHILPVTKIHEQDFTPHHHEVLAEMR